MPTHLETSSGTSTQSPPSWQQRSNQLAAIKHWQISGVLALKTQTDAFSANLRWQQTSQYSYIINLFGPLGMGAVNITGQPNLVVLQNNAQTYQAPTPEQLLATTMNWALPITNLYFWIRGIPAPNSPATTQFDQAHRLTQLKQQNWQINYLAYTKVGNLELPSRLVLSNPYLSARLIINQWAL